MEYGYMSLSRYLEVFANSSRKVKLAEEKEKGSFGHKLRRAEMG